MSRPRYRFSEFVVSPSRRALLRGAEEIPVIPRYLDLLILLLERRHEAVARQEIFEQVWSDVVVSDGALSQAVRTLRRTLGDDPREPVFIRTISRHGYRFVFPEVFEEPEDGPVSATLQRTARGRAPEDRGGGDPFEAPLARLLGAGPLLDDERCEAAETLHALGTAEALRRIGSLPGHATARALLRDTRWDVPGAGDVPLIGLPGAWGAVIALMKLRLRRAARQASTRWAAASAGGALAGVAAGLIGGSVLRLATGPAAPASLPVAFALVGAVIGGLGAAGVGAGLAAAETMARSRRGLALILCGGLGGGIVGAIAHAAGAWTLEDVFGHDLAAVGGGLEGLMLGAAAGLGYALATPRPAGGGMATPRGWERLSAAGITGLCCALAAVALSLSGRNLGGGSIEVIAHSFEGSSVSLAPLARLFGESEAGPVTRGLLSAYEGGLFGLGLALGLTHRPHRVS